MWSECRWKESPARADFDPRFEYGTLVFSDRKNRKIDENNFLKILGLDILGISLNKLIDEFAEEWK